MEMSRLTYCPRLQRLSQRACFGPRRQHHSGSRTGAGSRRLSARENSKHPSSEVKALSSWASSPLDTNTSDRAVACDQQCCFQMRCLWRRSNPESGGSEHMDGPISRLPEA